MATEVSIPEANLLSHPAFTELGMCRQAAVQFHSHAGAISPFLSTPMASCGYGVRENLGSLGMARHRMFHIRFSCHSAGVLLQCTCCGNGIRTNLSPKALCIIFKSILYANSQLNPLCQFSTSPPIPIANCCINAHLQAWCVSGGHERFLRLCAFGIHNF